MAENSSEKNLGMILHEGPLRVRQGSKWKSRWCVLSLSSPVSDKLRFTFKKEMKRQGDRKPEYKEKFSFECVDYCGMITELRIDSCQHAMCIVFAKKMLTLGFESKYSQTDWECRIRGVYGEENLFTFAVEIPPNPSSSFLSKVRSNVSAMMFIFNDNIAFATRPDDDVPQKLAAMKLSDVKCYGGDNRSRAVVLHLNKKVYSVKSNTPEAILKALDHVSGRRLLHESEVPDDIRSEMGSNEYGIRNPKANQDDPTSVLQGSAAAGCHSNNAYRLVMGAGGGFDSDESGGANMGTVASNASSGHKSSSAVQNITALNLHNQNEHHQNLQPLQKPNMPFSSSPNSSSAAALFSLDNTNVTDNVNSTMSSNSSHHTNSNPLSMMNPNMAMALAAIASGKGKPGSMEFGSGLAPLKTSDMFLNNDSLKSNPRSNPTTLGQPSPSGSYASYTQNGPYDEQDRSANSSNFFHQNQMSAFYEQDTSLQISVNLPPPSSHFTPHNSAQQNPGGGTHAYKSPENSSFHSSQISASGCSSNGTHTNSVFSSPREQDPDFGHEPPSVGIEQSASFYQGLQPPQRLPPAVPVRRPPLPPKRSPFAVPAPIQQQQQLNALLGQQPIVPPVMSVMTGGGGGEPSSSCLLEDSFYSVASERYESVLSNIRTTRRLRTSDFFCEQCSFRRWLSCPDISTSTFTPLDHKLVRRACTAKKCRNKHIADELFKKDSRYRFLSRVAWRKWGSDVNQMDMHRTTRKMRLGRRSKSTEQQSGHYYSHVMSGDGYSATSATISGSSPFAGFGTTGSNSVPTTTSTSISAATGESSHVYGAYSGSGSIELEGVDGVSIVVSSHDSTPLYDDIISNSNIPPPPPSIMATNTPASAAVPQSTPQRPGTAPNLLNNTTSGGNWKNVSPPYNSGYHQNVNNNGGQRPDYHSQQGAAPLGGKSHNNRHSKTPPPNPLNLQFKHQTTMDPQGNLRGHLYINLDYPTQTPVVTTTGGTHAHSSSSPPLVSNITAFADNPQSQQQQRSQQPPPPGKKFSAPFFPSQASNISVPGSRYSQASLAEPISSHHSREKTKMHKGGGGGVNISGASGGAAGGVAGAGNSNYSHLINVQNSVRNAAEKKGRDDSVTKRKPSRVKKQSSDLYQNLNPTFASRSAPTITNNTVTPSHSYENNAPAIRPRQQPENSMFNPQESESRTDMKVATDAWNSDMASRSNQSQAANQNQMQSSRQQCVNRWIDNAVELSHYSRDNSPDTFIAATASISDSRDDVFLTDNEQQITMFERTSISNSGLPKSVNTSPPEPPPPRQKTHNYHNIDPFLNINHKHCPDAELGVGMMLDTSTISDGSTATAVNARNQARPPVTQSRGPWQDITPPRRPMKLPSSSSSKAYLQQSPRRVTTKPPVSASRKNVYVLNERENSSSAVENYGFLSFNSGSADSISGVGRTQGHENANAGFADHQNPMFGAQVDFSHRSAMGMHVQSSMFPGSNPNAAPHKGRQPSFNAHNHNISATGRSKSESRTAVASQGGSTGLQMAPAPSSANRQNTNAVNYSMMDAQAGANPVAPKKLSQVSKVEKSLVQYSLVDGQLTKALHDAGKQHSNNRTIMANQQRRRKLSGKSSLVERHPSLTGPTQGKGGGAYNAK